MVVPQRSVSSLRYTDLDSVIEDVVRLSRQRLESVERRLKAEEAEVSQTLSERNLGWGHGGIDIGVHCIYLFQSGYNML